MELVSQAHSILKISVMKKVALPVLFVLHINHLNVQMENAKVTPHSARLFGHAHLKDQSDAKMVLVWFQRKNVRQ
jgi:hypothetical protein